MGVPVVLELLLFHWHHLTATQAGQQQLAIPGERART